MDAIAPSGGSSGSLLANIESGSSTPTGSPTSSAAERQRKVPSSKDSFRVSFSPKIGANRSPLREGRNKLSGATMTTILSFQERVIPGGGLGGLED